MALNLITPASNDVWGEQQNANLQDLDDRVSALQTSAGGVITVTDGDPIPVGTPAGQLIAFLENLDPNAFGVKAGPGNVSTFSDQGSANAAECTLTKPANTAVGDTLMAWVWLDNVSDISTPSGWTELFDVPARLGLYSLYINDQTELDALPSSWDWTGTSGTASPNEMGILFRVTNADMDTPPTYSASGNRTANTMSEDNHDDPDHYMNVNPLSPTFDTRLMVKCLIASEHGANRTTPVFDKSSAGLNEWGTTAEITGTSGDGLWTMLAVSRLVPEGEEVPADSSYTPLTVHWTGEGATPANRQYRIAAIPEDLG
jgi:hypothetical protein